MMGFPERDSVLGGANWWKNLSHSNTSVFNTIQLYEPAKRARHKTKVMQILSHDLCPLLFARKVPHTNNLSHLFWNLKHFVLGQTLSYEKNTLPLVTDCHSPKSSFNAGFLAYDVAWKCSSTAVLTLISYTNEFFPTNDKETEVNGNF